MKVRSLTVSCLLALCVAGNAQLKFLIEDFEGAPTGNTALKAHGIFTYGNIKANVDDKLCLHKDYSGSKALRVDKDTKMEYGGWGIGISLNVDLDATKDHFNFYIHQPASNGNNKLRISIQEDDNGDGSYDKNNDDDWEYHQEISNKDNWSLVSIPLSAFTDANQGGDGVFNVSYKTGKLLCIVIGFDDLKTDNKQSWTFDFLSFSQGKLATGSAIFDAPKAGPQDGCSLGAWSKEGNLANFVEIASAFEKNFEGGSSKKLGVVHFFQPFGSDGGSYQKFYPSKERIDKVVAAGYIPMITLEDHFIKIQSGTTQPNLYSIVEGHFDHFFRQWAKEIKQVNSLVLLRILHEFNGNWYPWCISNNDQNPELLKKAFVRIHSIFKEEQVTNVKFIWCPNSMSVPQERWNSIMDAYPGDEYVDLVGLDIYNGAGKEPGVWRSFRKEGIENYFVLTQRLPNKPLLVCEVASRERNSSEPSTIQDKAGWIADMAHTLKTDMSKVKLISWFNEKETFRINSSPEAKKSFLTNIMNDDYFKSGPQHLRRVTEPAKTQ